MSIGPRRTLTVGRADAGQTVAAVIHRELKLSWTHARRAIAGGRVRLNGGVCSDPTKRLRAGQRVEVSDDGTAPSAAERVIPKPKPERPKKGRMPTVPKGVAEPQVVFTDAAIVVVEKPVGLTTMRHDEEAAEFGERGRRFLPVTLIDLLPGLLNDHRLRARAVHRIDRDTSGLVVFARTAAADRHLSEQFRAHSVHRRYLALTRGVPTVERLESRFVRDRGDGRRGSTNDPEAGQRAVTHLRVLEAFDGFALVECKLETGRTHQVRIHLGEHGTPLCGERIYDRPLRGSPLADDSGAERPMLHAAELGLVHPVTRDVMHWQSEPATDFARLLGRLRAASSPRPGSE